MSAQEMTTEEWKERRAEIATQLAQALPDIRQTADAGEVERSFLGALLRWPANFAEIAHVLKPHDFEYEVHGGIYHSIATQIEIGEGFTPATLDLPGASDDTRQYVVRLLDYALTQSHITHFAENIRRRSAARQLTGWCQAAISEVVDPNRVDNLIAEGSSLLDALRETGTARRPSVSGGDAARDAIAESIEMRRARDAGEELPIISTGLDELDQLIGGLRPAELVVLAGATSSGKSALAQCIATAAAKAGKPAGIQSLEMLSTQLGQRAIAAESNVPVWRIRDGKISDDDVARMQKAQIVWDSLPIMIDDNPECTIAELAQRARSWKRRFGLKLLIVDYIQLMETLGHNRGNRAEEIGAITRGLKRLAMELRISVVALSQLNRGVDSRDNHRPQLSDLRESGSIEQDADVVLFVYREAYYSAKQAPAKTDPAWIGWDVDQQILEKKAEIIAAKQRQGVAGAKREVGFNGETTSFHTKRADDNDAYNHQQEDLQL